MLGILLKKQNPRELYDNGINAYKKGDYKVAIKFLSKSLKNDKENPKIMNAMALCYSKMDNNITAKYYLLKACKKSPINETYKKNLAIIDNIENQKKEAEKKKIEIDKQNKEREYQEKVSKRLEAEKRKSGKIIDEYRRTCNKCGKVWHSLVSREKELAKLKSDYEWRSIPCCSGLLTAPQYQRNRDAVSSDIEMLKQCPNCKSKDYNEEIVSHEV
ncbi:hypothetical protein DK846_01845 [Methanospirillum lacunae]|uniref:Uncharacterized protein n=2 Tax=Methanospirillum lacunae TaxID=668570 RepID=A0A2V2N192_9EURY|nr:hypothetical protein DK846_01845 [Methanospirillum lacunae]